MKEFSILKVEQIYGDSALEVIKKSGTRAVITDFSILLGGYVSNGYHIDESTTLDKRTGWYWTKTDDRDNDALVVSYAGFIHHYYVNRNSGSIRMSLPFSKQLFPILNKIWKLNKNGVLEIEYGYYPRNAVSKSMQEKLNNEYKLKKLNKTGNTYTVNSNNCNEKFRIKLYTEYEYRNKRYVRIEANSYYENFTLSNGEIYKRGNNIWVEVEPVKWLVDEKEKIMITDELIFSGVQFNNESNYKGEFEKTDIKSFIDKYLSKELFQNSDTININDNTDTLISKTIKDLYSKGYTEEQIQTITIDILNQMGSHTTPNKTYVKQKLKTLNK